MRCNAGQIPRKWRSMTENNIPRMIDMVFDLDGGTLPATYPFALWAALIHLVPQLAEEKSVGVLPLSATENIKKQLGELSITGKLICGRRLTINGGQNPIQGYSLVLHDLKAEASLQLQYLGLGEDRQFGCGIFIPYKVISGLSED